jgi:hypothetical protein
VRYLEVRVKEGEVPGGKGKTALGTLETPETLGKQAPRDSGAGGAESEGQEVGNSHLGYPTPTSTLPQGYEYSQLEGYDP